MSNINELIEQGTMAVKSGDKVAARLLLVNALQINDKNEQAWLWLSGAVDSNAERKYCIEKVLEINPQNQAAKKGFTVLAGVSAIPLYEFSQTGEGKREEVELREIKIIKEPKKSRKLRTSQNIRKIAISPNELFCAGIGQDFNLYLWRISDSSKQWQVKEDYHPEILTFTPPGNFIATSATTTVAFIHGNSGRLEKEWPLSMNKVVFSRNGNSLVGWAMIENEFYIINANNGRVMRTLKLRDLNLRAIDISSNDEYFAILFDSDVLWIGLIKTGEIVHRIEIEAREMSFHPSDTLLAANDLFGKVALVNTLTGEWASFTKETTGIVEGIAWSQDGSTLIVWDTEGEINIYNHPGYDQVETYKGKAGKVYQVIPNKNGSALTILNEDGTVEFWSLS